MITPEITTYIVKTVDGCNLGCLYCYVPFEEHQIKIISLDLIEKLILGISTSSPNRVQIVWHGGEPLIAKQSFFHKMLEIQEKYRRPDQYIFHSIQTNATLLDGNWIDFLVEHHFGIGISIDGPQLIHDLQRPFLSKYGSYNRINKNIELLKERGVSFAASVVVTSLSAHEPEKMYDFFKEHEIFEYDLLPCLPYEHNPYSQPFAIEPEEFAKFLMDYFDIWFEDNDERVRIRYFVEIVKGMLNHPVSFCKFMSTCAGFSTLLANGEIYPCDSFAGKTNYCFGNLNQTSLGEIAVSQTRLNYIVESQSTYAQCQSCPWFSICKGGCPFHRYTGINYYQDPEIFCRGYKELFQHIHERVHELNETSS